MRHRKLCLAAAAPLFVAAAAHAAPVKTVFVIAMENHNWTQPNGNTGGLTSIEQIYGNPNAPYINSLVTPGNPNAAQTSYASQYFNVLAGTGQSIHPSEPNYIWSEAGSNLGVLNDNTPYGTNGTNQNTTDHLSTYLTGANKTWKSYQEDTDVDSNGNVLPQSQWTSPINNRSGTYSPAGGVPNAYNGSLQYDYAVKHNPTAFFTDSNGGNDTTPANPAAKFYAPLQQFQTDLTNNTVANYNWITPNQFNDMHTALAAGYKGLTGDAAKIKQGDDFLAQIVPLIQASQAYKDNGAIVIWNDETEPQASGDNANDFNHTSMEIVLSPLAKGNAYNSTLAYTHSSDLKTYQELFNAYGPNNQLLGDAASPGTNDLSDLFVANAVATPEPASLAVLSLGAVALLRRRRA